MIIPKANASVLLNGPPSRGPVETCWVRFVRIPTTIPRMVGLPHATNKVDQALPSKESLRESSIPNRV